MNVQNVQSSGFFHLSHRFEEESLDNSGWKRPLEILRFSCGQAGQSLFQWTEVKEVFHCLEQPFFGRFSAFAEGSSPGCVARF